LAVPTSAQKKGDALHRAVSTLEHYILGTSPSLKEKTFLFENKKIVCVGGVHHEIDIFVTVDIAPGYRAVYIFECKNWKKAVGKNEIVDFSEKIDALQATHGYFVAKSFTKDARAQAKKDSRVTLLVATEHDPTEIPIPGDLHLTETAAKQLGVSLSKRGRAKDALYQPVDIGSAKAELHGIAIDFRDYLNNWADEVMNQDTLKFPSGHLAPGKYERKTDSTRTYEPKELLFDGRDIEYITMEVHYTVTLHKPPVVTHFDIESRDRVLSLAPVMTTHAGMVQMSVLQDPNAP
jgi:hypothetical protein